MMKCIGVFFVFVGVFCVVLIVQVGGDLVVKLKQEIQLMKNVWGCLLKDNLDFVLSYECDGKLQVKQQYFDDFCCLLVLEGQCFCVVLVDQGDVQFVSVDNSDQ